MVTPGKRVTVHDIAKLADVSAMTVSRVISGKQSTTTESARRVLQAIADTGFRMNRAASNLRQGQVRTTIGLVVDRLDDPFFARVMSAAQEVAVARGALLVVTSAPQGGPDNQQNTVSSLLSRSVDGLLLYPSSDEKNLLSEGQPLVLIARTAGIEDTDAVLVDNMRGARDGVAHLIQCGHRRIGLVDFGEGPLSAPRPRFVDTRSDRLLGYEMAHIGAGLAVDHTLVEYAGRTVEGARAATLALLNRSNPPTAFFALNGRMTAGILHALGSSLGKYGLVGIDDLELADLFDPPITVVAQDPELMGRRGAEFLLDRLEDPSRPIQRLELDMKLIIRGSGAIRS
ncbi:MAG: LacI family DNA-binding transcriptional regulator [Rhodoglobus sp.]